MNSPRVLILNQPFVRNTGGGITLSNLFAKWDRDKLAVACSGYLLTREMDPNLCDNYYQLGSKERKWIFPLSLFRRKYYSGPVKPKGYSQSKIVEKKSPWREKVIMQFIYPVMDYLGFSHFVTRTHISSNLDKWLQNFEPQILYTQASSLDDILFCIEIKKHLNIPLIFHMMDDWPSTLNRKGLGSKYWMKRVNNALKDLLENTEIAMSISDYMAKEYKDRYGKDFITFHNHINIDFWKKAQKIDYSLNSPPSILYAGRIGLGIDESLKMIAKAIEIINRREKYNLKFSLQTQEIPSWIETFSCVEHRNFVEYNELPKVFAEADFLILPYDFNSKSIKFIKYSMPTKAPEFMASGTPIIIFSPEDTAIVKYARKYGWASIVTENTVEHLVQKISELLEDLLLRKKIAQQAIQIAEERHDADKVSTDFKKAIIAALYA